MDLVSDKKKLSNYCKDTKDYTKHYKDDLYSLNLDNSEYIVATNTSMSLRWLFLAGHSFPY